MCSSNDDVFRIARKKWNMHVLRRSNNWVLETISLNHWSEVWESCHAEHREHSLQQQQLW